jgi:hypothetical protein
MTGWDPARVDNRPAVQSTLVGWVFAALSCIGWHAAGSSTAQ